MAASRLPALHRGEDGTTQISLIPFAGRYHRLNPKKLWPSKTALMRTVTVLGETVSTCKKYVNYYMTNRKIQMLDEEHAEYGCYVCDYNGAVSYLSFEKMQIIGNRYGFTNARVRRERLSALDVGPLPQFSRPENPLAARNSHSVCCIKDDSSTSDYEISVLRHYADSFFSVRRQRLDFDEGSPENAVTEALFSEDSGRSARICSEMLCQVKTPYFQPIAAFDTMLDMCGSQRKRFANLHTPGVLSRDIQDKYCDILLAEQEITAVLTGLEQELCYKLHGLDFRIKSSDSLYEKLYERADGDSKSLEEIFGSIRDILRYTVCFDRDEDYCRNSIKLPERLMDSYFGQMESFKNYWAPYASGEYRGINVPVRLPDMCWDMREKKLKSSRYAGSRYCVAIPAFCFEVQFHTQVSLEVKEKTHKLYERSRRSDTSEEECRLNNAEIGKQVLPYVNTQGLLNR